MQRLEHEVFAELAIKEGQQIVDEASQCFAITGAVFDACRHIIDAVKPVPQRLPKGA